MAATMAGDFEGRARLLPGEGFAVPDGPWRLALRAATESCRRPVAHRSLQTRRFTTAQGRLWARVSSAAPAPGPGVVLVHGVIVSSRYLIPLGAELAAHFPVVFPDLPGYGLSDAPRWPPTLARLADATIACARAAGHERVSLVGNSFGAQIAVEAAIRHPDSVDRIALIGPTTDPQARSLARQYVRWQRCALDEHLAILPIMARDLIDVGPRRAAHLLRVMLNDRIEDKLPRVRAPAVIIRGGRDRVAPKRWAQHATDLLPHGRLTVIPGYAHMPHWSGTLVLAPVLRDFLNCSHKTTNETVPPHA
ncbi:MAG: alpha/beta fold hydrolase [Actinomycetota bacterium]|nr:alpha/beta fold hydrolase [Actinomycetota bacterium]